ncbi:alcohol dehydrogenase catalytic domain-containing protein [Actinocorallia sp. API 0066]|uniref:zinc-binding dehydrogenase n=1 Tax=Actinocorallia sp. API 0066 TaxID=2896846 RepID=UPI001E483AEC|nr:alcohol dehydrogenase catalytic domain-containing protein [Actinocorallia sp. API 0066]MCD0449798.1 alcohol dehydrogenase catalytic domain-containing protein [Actinocorallia sp. API 0066]
MRATLLYGAGDVRVEEVPDPVIRQPSDALVRVLRSCICGSDLWPYEAHNGRPVRIGHEFLGVVEEVGADVAGLRRGDVVVAPFMYADNTCEFCAEGLHTSCRGGGMWGAGDVDGGQGEAVRVPQAQGTLVRLPVGEDAALLPSLLTLADVFPTGHHAAVTAGVGPRTTVVVVGDGAVGLSAVLAARRLGAERIVLLGRHKDRTDLGVEFGATDVVAERGAEAVARVKELTGGRGAHAVLECVGLGEAMDTALRVTRAGGTISRVGAPQYQQVSFGGPAFMKNLTLTGGVAPVRAYIEDLLPDVLEGRVNPGRVFDLTLPLAEAPAGYAAMASRTALKVLLHP